MGDRAAPEPALLRGPDPQVVEIWREVAGAGRCRHPIHLVAERIDTDTGEILTSSVRIACKDRRSVLCPSCAAVYKADAWFLVTAGLSGGKGMPETLAEHPRLFLTLTAPSFGEVHTIRDDGTCHPGHRETCGHGRSLGCSVRHEPSHDDVGSPLCEDCFDWEDAVLWNALASRLWNRTIDKARRELAFLRGLTLSELRQQASVQYLRVAEIQRRGLVHFHAVVRADGPEPASRPPPSLTTGQLERSIRRAIATTRVQIEDWMVAQRGRQLDTAVTYTERLEEIGAVPSIGTVGDSFDNALAESMFATFKTELFRNPAVLSRVDGHWKGLDDLEIETAKWVSWFNEERLHAELGDRTPLEVEEDYGANSQALVA